MLSRILGRDYNDQHLHDMHNSLFEGFQSGFGHTGESMHLANLLTHLTAFLHEQNQQIQHLIDELNECVK
jgi:hypothetical protein